MSGAIVIFEYARSRKRANAGNGGKSLGEKSPLRSDSLYHIKSIMFRRCLVLLDRDLSAHLGRSPAFHDEEYVDLDSSGLDDANE
jgi:hypothetical protein